MDTASPDPRRARQIVDAALVHVDDLPGAGWTASEDTEPLDEDGHAGDEIDLPAAFPEAAVVAVADATFVRESAGALIICTLATVFDTQIDAAGAWSAMADRDAAEAFAVSIADETLGPTSAELLGPTMLEPTFRIVRGSTRTVTNQARYSSVVGEHLIPLSLDLASIQIDTLVVLVWLAARGAVERDTWNQVVERAELRSELAVRAS